MARSFRYEHFTVPTSGADRDRSRRDKQEIAAQRGQEGGSGQVHYGKQFAETEATHQSRAETRAKGHSPSPSHSEAESRRTQDPSKSRRTQDPSRGRVATRSATDEHPPLGATAAEEVPAADPDLAETPLEQLEAFRDHAIRSFVALGKAGRQFGTAGREMAGLPVQALRLLIRIGRAWLGVAPGRGRTV